MVGPIVKEAIMANPAFLKLIENLSANKNVQSLLNSFQTLSKEIRKRESQIKGRIDQKKEEQIELAWKKYQEIVKVLSASEAKLDKEVKSTIVKIKKSADALEKNLQAYKKKAIAQKNQLEKTIFAAKKNSRKAKTKKAVGVRKTTKKVARKTTKKAARK